MTITQLRKQFDKAIKIHEICSKGCDYYDNKMNNIEKKWRFIFFLNKEWIQSYRRNCYYLEVMTRNLEIAKQIYSKMELYLKTY